MRFRVPFIWQGVAVFDAENKSEATDKIFNMDDETLLENSCMGDCDWDDPEEVDNGYYEISVRTTTKWHGKARMIAGALLQLGWKYIVKSEENIVWVFTNKPERADWRNDIKYRCMGRETMLCLVMDMHYDPTTDTYKDDKLWEKLGHKPVSLWEIYNG